MVDAEDPALPPHVAASLPERDGQAKPATVHGVHFQTMGRYESSRRRLELLPEEALYLIERGTVECWTDETPCAVPFTLQHAWSTMIRAHGMSAERYQVSLMMISGGPKFGIEVFLQDLRIFTKTWLHSRASGLPSIFFLFLPV